MNQTTATQSVESPKKFTLIKKFPRAKLPTLLIVFSWIAVCNIVFQLLHHRFHDMPIANWAFFLSVTVFFMQEELKPMQRFSHTLVGGAVGLLLAAGVVYGTKLLVTAGLDKTLSTCILLITAIGMLILLSPPIPLVFNNVGFCYFIISLIDSSTTVSKLPVHLLSLLLGSIVLNLGCIGLLKLYGKAKAKKALNK